MSYAKSLRNALKDKNETLFHKLQPIEDAAKSVLIYTVSKFPYYTPHDFSHSQNVEEILNWLVPDEIKSKMNDYEIFFLLIASWLHDWGMVASEEENADEVRRLHHIRTEANFEKLYDKIRISLTEARIVGRVCRGHRKEDILSSEYDDTFFGSNILIRVRFLAALLRVADECDVTANRTPEVIYYSLKPEGASEEEFRKHLSITGIGKSAPYKLLLSGVAKTPKGVEVIEGVKNQIQSQLNSVKAILANHDVVLDIIEAHIDTRGFINKPIAFDLDQKAIVTLLIGNALYSRKDVAVRELLQNAVDTCRIRKLVDDNFEPHIEVEFGREKVSFEDNGLGMNFEDALDFFSKKGNSFYVSKDLQKILEGKKFDPISKFGIGVLSSFLIANKMVVETKRKNCAPCRFTITDLAEGWTYEEGSRQEPGTQVILFLNEQGKKIDIEKSLGHYAKNIKIPIFIKRVENGERQEFVQTWTYNMPEVLEACSKDVRERISQSKPFLTIHEVTSDLEVTYCIFKERLFEDKNCFLLKHGVYVGNFDLFPSVDSRWIALINCTSDSVDLAVSRENIVHNKKLKGFLGLVYDTLFNSITRRCASISDDLMKCTTFSRYFGLLFFQHFGEKLESMKTLWNFKFNTKRIYPVLLRSGLTFLSGEQIMSRSFANIIHYVLPRKYGKEHIETVTQILSSKMKENEAIVFDFGPNLLYVRSVPREFLCSFCETVKTKSKSTLECMRLADLIPKLEFAKEATQIDLLLPPGSFFAHMGEHLRSLTAQVKRFEFEPSLETLTGSKAVQDILYYRLAAREIFRNEPEISNLYNSQLLGQERRCNLSSFGQFVYDADDPFLRFIISQADCVLSSELVRKLIERYLRLLATFCLSLSVREGIAAESESIVLLERIIAEALGYTETYLPLWNRMGKLSLIYNLEEI